MLIPDNFRVLTAPTPPITWTKTANRPLRSFRRSAGIWLFAHFMGVPVPWRAVHQTDARALLAYEHGRLLALGAAGEAVPPVLSFDGHTLVTGDIGRTFNHTIDELPLAQQLPIMCAAAADLAQFHARGHWHGGAQARNLTWDGRRFARLDFEEPLHPAMPLETVQLYDALQLLLSFARFLEAMDPSAVRDVLAAYRLASLAACRARGRDAPDLPGFLRPLLPRLRFVRRVVDLLPRLRTSREAVRLRIVLDGMSAFVDECTMQGNHGRSSG